MIPVSPFADSAQAPDVSSAAFPGSRVKPSSTERAKLGEAAGEFESILLETLWKSMKETFSDPSDKDSDPTLGNYDDFGMQAMAGAVGKAGALGIKAMILQHLAPNRAGGSRAGNAQ